MATSRFIALEGIDGSGKSTQTRLLAQRIKAMGLSVYETFEPTNNFIGSLIRDILKGERTAHDKTIAGLFVADRLHHILNEEDGMLKMLKEGFHVISDRYYFSSYAYHGTHMDIDWVIDANRMAADTLKPDLTVFIDVEPDLCMQRIRAGRETTELYETLENLQRVRQKYFEAFERTRASEKLLLVEGNADVEKTAALVWEGVKHLF